MRGWPIQDIATTMFYLHRRPEYGEWLSEFRRGYEAVAVWPERYEGEMDTFIIGRYLVLANGVLIAPEWMPLAAEYFERWEVPLRTLLA
jgi:hypothetical protein